MHGTEQEKAEAPAVRDAAIAWLAKLRGHPTDRECAEFESWYAADPLHSETYDQLLRSWDETARLPHEADSLDEAFATRRWSWPIVSAAAGFFLVLLAGALILPGIGGHSSASATQYATRTGEIRIVPLEDGSEVTLDTSTEIAVTLDDSERRVRLVRGRARFRVAQEGQRPFLVEAGKSEVIAHGTVFDVDHDQGRLVVTLLEGRVEVRDVTPAGASTATRTMLGSGQQVVIEGGARAASPQLRAARDTGWPSGMLSFQDAPLVEVVAVTNRYNDLQILLASEELGARRFTGTFRSTEPEQLGAMIAAMFDVVNVRQPGDATLTISPRE